MSKPATDSLTSTSRGLPLLSPSRPIVARFLYLYKQVAGDVTEAPPVPWWNHVAGSINRGPGYLCRYSKPLQAGRAGPGNESRWGRDFPDHPASYKIGTEYLPRG